MGWGKVIKCFEVVPDKIHKPCGQFINKVGKIRKSMRITTQEKCKAVLYFIPIVSRAGTDIQAALQDLQDRFGDKDIALVVLHHTFERELIVADSSRNVNRDKTITVDCLFSEDEGLLKCRRNDEAIKRVADWLREVKHRKEPKTKQKRTSKKSKNQPKTRQESTSRESENQPKTRQESTSKKKSKTKQNKTSKKRSGSQRCPEEIPQDSGM